MRRLISVICVFSVMLMLVSCGGGSRKTVYFMAETAVSTLDPQLAANRTELMAAESMFEGLYTSKGGEIVLGAAEKADISDDGLTYTFTLREDIYWSDGTSVTAQDFKFGLERALTPSTGAPYAYKLYAIRNAKNIHSGGADAGTLGVEAADDKTLIITLEYPSTALPRMLALPVAMPCSRDFFEKSGGRYGLGKDDILTNGVYYVKAWDEKKLSLSLNKYYRDDAVNLGVNISYADADDDIPALINDGKLDAGIIYGADDGRADELGISKAVSLDTCYALLINRAEKSGIGNENIVKALNLSLDKSHVLEALPEYYRTADVLIPPELTVSGGMYGGSGSYSAEYDLSAAKELWSKAVGGMSGKKLPKTTLLYPDDAGMDDIVKSVAQGWEKNLGCYLTIQSVSRRQLTSSVAYGKYSMALVPITSYDGTAGSLITEFGTAGLYGSVSDDGFDAILTEDSLAQSSDPVAMISAAEKYLLDGGYVIPLFFGESGVAYGGSLDKSSVFAAAGGYISLRELVKS